MQRTLILILTLVSATSLAQTDEETQREITAAMEGGVRTEAEIVRDANRLPVETLSFFGLQDDMRVLELLPGGGWYTKLLAPVLRDDGKLYLAIGTNNARDNVLTLDGFDKVEVLDIDSELDRSGPFNTVFVAPFEFGVRDLDLVLTFRNMHNFTPEGRGNINNAVFKSLKSGGRYGVVDHSRRHMEPMTAENRRRADVVQIIEEVQAAGFRLVDYSDLHYRPDDELRYEVGRHTVTGNTDRFTLLFEKP